MSNRETLKALITKLAELQTVGPVDEDLADFIAAATQDVADESIDDAAIDDLIEEARFACEAAGIELA